MNINYAIGTARKVICLLKHPFPYFQKKGQFVALITLCIFVVLTIVQYYAFDSKSFYLFVGFVGGFTAISAICSAIVIYFFPILFKRFFDEKQWTRGKYFVFILVLIFMIGIANALYDYMISTKAYHKEISFFICLYENLITAYLIGSVPTVFGYFWMKKQELHSNLQEKEDQNRKLISRVQEKGVSDEEIITLSGTSKDSLTLFPSELLYIESSGNYARVYYKTNEQISQKTLRATLLQMEDFLSDYPFLVRCHRAFMVNVYQIEKIKGTKLWLKSTEVAIPISKTHKANILKQIG